MIALMFDGAQVIGAPSGWDQELDGNVGGLPVAVSRDTLSGLVKLTSVWRPSEDELALLLAGGGIALDIHMPQHPIICLRPLTPEQLRAVNALDHLDLSPPTQEKS